MIIGRDSVIEEPGFKSVARDTATPRSIISLAGGYLRIDRKKLAPGNKTAVTPVSAIFRIPSELAKSK